MFDLWFQVSLVWVFSVQCEIKGEEENPNEADMLVLMSVIRGTTEDKTISA